MSGSEAAPNEIVEADELAWQCEAAECNSYRCSIVKALAGLAAYPWALDRSGINYRQRGRFAPSSDRPTIGVDMLLRGIITAVVLVASIAMWYGLVAIPQGLFAAVELFSRSGSSRTPWATVADLWLLVTMVMTSLLAHAVWTDSDHLSGVSILWSGSFLGLVALSGASYGFWALGLTAVGVIGLTYAAVQWLRIRTNADTLRG